MNLRSRLDSQCGAALLIIIGIGAALAVMTASLVIVIGNMQANTADSRTRDKAATVGEAAMDAQMFALARNWPKTSTPSPVPSLDTATLRDQFNQPPTNEFPNTTGDFVSAVYYDDSDTNNDSKVDVNDAHWDSNGNRRMYVEAQGKVNGRATRFQALVERTFVDTTFPHGIAVYSEGPWDVNGAAGRIDVQVSGGYSVNAYTPGLIDQSSNPGAYFNGVIKNENSTLSLESVLPQTFRNQIVVTAQSLPGGSMAGTRYYDCANPDPLLRDTVPVDKSGLCVIKVPSGTTVDLGNGGNSQINSPTSPGILFILGGTPENPVHSVAIGTVSFYGVFYTDGILGTASGTQDFYGMCIAQGGIDFGGNTSIHYNDTLIAQLADLYTLTVKLVPNTWREIHPL